VLVDVHSGEFGDWDVQVLRLGNGAVSGRLRWTMKVKSESVGRCVSRVPSYHLNWSLGLAK
jgi:hypothetical protein